MTQARTISGPLPTFAPAPERARPGEPPPRHDFAALVGRAGWMRLAPAIRERFAADAAATARTYLGAMTTVRCSAFGYALAQLCRLFGTPLAPFEGRFVPATANVFEAEDGTGIVWERIYRFPGRRPISIRSTKVFTRDETLLECVGGGFGMRLRVFERDGALHFLSTSYFWRVGPWTVTLPALLTPGTAHVVHADEGCGLFRFTMSMRHPMLGETYFQDGVFGEEE